METSVDLKILSKMKEMGFDTAVLKKKLDAGMFTSETACYKLLS